MIASATEFDDDHGGGGRQAADEGQQRDDLGAGRQRQGEHERVGIEGALRQRQQAGGGNGHHENIDQHQVERKQPGGAANLRLGIVLDDGHVELARQQHDAHEAEEGHRDPVAGVEALRERPLRLGVLQNAADEPAEAAEHGEDDEKPDGEEGRQLDEGFRRHRDDQALLVLGRIDMARAEQHRERGHRQRNDEGRVGRQVEVLERARAQQRVDRDGDRLQLQRDIGQRPGHGDHGDDGGDGLALAVARRQEVGDRGDVLALGQADDAHQEAPAEYEQQDRSEVDRDEIVAVEAARPTLPKNVHDVQ